MGMYEWAQKEVEAACERERKLASKDAKPGGADYGVFCYKSALRAYKSLCDDGHTGMSLQMTKSILNRLIACRPLTPIEDAEDAWRLVGEDIVTGVKNYQNTRMGGLFKRVRPDGCFSYHDVDRTVLHDLEGDRIWSVQLANEIVDGMFPIAMPYTPPDKSYVVQARMYTPHADGRGEIIALIGVECPDGDYVPLSRFFKCTAAGWKEIDEFDFCRLRAASEEIAR